MVCILDRRMHYARSLFARPLIMSSLVLDDKLEDSPYPAGRNDYYGADPWPVRWLSESLKIPESQESIFKNPRLKHKPISVFRSLQIPNSEGPRPMHAARTSASVQQLTAVGRPAKTYVSGPRLRRNKLRQAAPARLSR